MNEGYADSMQSTTNGLTTPCPKCGVPKLHIEYRMVAKPIGTFSLSGTQMKFSTHAVPYLVCKNCGVEAEGKS